EKKSLAGLGDPGSNPHTVFRGSGDTVGNRSYPSFPVYWVNTANLNLVIQTTDFVSSGRGPAVAVRRTYNSQSPYALMSSTTSTGGIDYLLSQGWTHAYDSFIDLTCAGAYVVNRGGTGKMLFFPYPGNLCTANYPVQLVSPVGTSDRLTHYGTYLEYLEKDTGLLYRYDLKAEVSQAWLTTIADRNGQTVQIHYNEVGQVVKVTDAAGRETTFTYDTKGLLNTIVTPDLRTINAKDFGYWIFYPGIHTFNYDTVAPGYTGIKSLKSGDTLTYFEYNVVNGEVRISKVTDALGKVTTYEVVSESPRRVKVTDPRGGIWLYDSNENFQTTRIEDPTGAVQTFTYDAKGLPVSITHPHGKATLLEYDDRGNLTKQIDPAGGVTTHAYDEKDRRISTTNALGGTWHYTYDGQGRPLSVISPAGRRTDLTYDGAGNPVAVTDPGGAVTSLTYDSKGNLTSVTDPLGNTTTFAYDAAGLRMLSGSDPLGGKVEFTYDDLGRLTRVGYPGGGFRTFGYDAVAFASVRDANGSVIAFMRDPLGRMTGVSRENGSGLTLSYDG
ncbi:MAG: hypothetical protein N2Z74_06690, partial [Syntrophales bacterium]|nr:hypothetical protein [Syntrophales bacterium]